MAKKRAFGEGSIIKRDTGYWMAAATINGQRVYFSGKSQGDVKKKLDEAQEQARKGMYVKPTKQTFGEWMDTWLKEYAKPTVRSTTYDSYEYLMRIHIKPGLGSVNLKELQPTQIQKFYNDKLKQKLMDRRSDKTKKKQAEKVKKGLMVEKDFKTIAPATIRRMHIIINEALDQAFKEGKIPRNPAQATKPPKVERKEARYLTPEQLNYFFEKISEDYWYPAFIVAVNTGVRLGELVALKWSNVEIKKAKKGDKKTIEGGTIYIKEAVSWVRSGDGWKLESHPPKSQKGIRSIPLPVAAAVALDKIKTRQASFKLLLGELYKGDPEKEYIFTWQDGRIVDPFYLSKHFRELIHENGLSVNFHGLRHSYATALLTAGEHPKVVQELLGDSTISVVLDTYTHVVPGLKERAASKLEEIFNPKSKVNQ